jgi:hypothetical protein
MTFLGTGLIAFGVFRLLNDAKEDYPLVVVGAILTLAIIVKISIDAIREVLEKRKTD